MSKNHTFVYILSFYLNFVFVFYSYVLYFTFLGQTYDKTFLNIKKNEIANFEKNLCHHFVLK